MLIIVVGILYEGLKTLREMLAGREAKKGMNSNMAEVNVQNNEAHNDKTHLLPPQSKVGIR